MAELLTEYEQAKISEWNDKGQFKSYNEYYDLILKGLNTGSTTIGRVFNNNEENITELFENIHNVEEFDYGSDDDEEEEENEG